MKVVAIVGMNGSGKSEVSAQFEEAGFIRIRFGDITDKELYSRGMEINEENERRVRKVLRDEHGMEAYAVLNLPIINEALNRAHVVVDGLYSWEEYRLLKEQFGDDLIIIAVYASPETRQKRLPNRNIRPLSPEESLSRDYNEIEKLNKGGPIAMADFTLINESTLQELKGEAGKIISSIAS